MTLTVGAMWRYPVKTLAGEQLETAEITALAARTGDTPLVQIPLLGDLRDLPALARLGALLTGADENGP